MNNENFSDFCNVNYQELSNYLSALSPLEFATIGCAIGLMFIPILNANQQNALGNFFELIGQVMLASAAQDILLQPDDVTVPDFENYKKDISSQINLLLKKINNLENK